MKPTFAPLQLKTSALEALAAALAAGVALVLGLPIWAMFLGWNAYFTRGAGLRSGLINFACVVIGLSLGMTTQFLLSTLPGAPGVAEQMGSVFAVTLVVLSLRLLPEVNNVPGFFLGLIAYFASRLEPGGHALLVLGGAALLGTTAGWITSAVHNRWFFTPEPAELPRS